MSGHPPHTEAAQGSLPNTGPGERSVRVAVVAWVRQGELWDDLWVGSTVRLRAFRPDESESFSNAYGIGLPEAVAANEEALRGRRKGALPILGAGVRIRPRGACFEAIGRCRPMR